MSKVKGKGGSIMVIPFRFTGNDCAEDKSALIKKLASLRSKDTKGVFSPNYYPDYCSYHMGNANQSGKIEDNDPYLKFYNIQFKDNHPFNSDKCFIKGRKGVNGEPEKLYFKLNQIQLILNENKQNNKLPIGYWLLNFEWLETDADSILNILSGSSFFRYHGFEQAQKKSQVFILNEENETEDAYSLKEMLYQEVKLNDFTTLDYYQNKPTILHLLPKGEESKIQKGIKAYKALRVPPENWQLPSESEQSVLLNLNEISLDSYLLTMDEGAVVFESGANEFKNIKNKYFPAFILAVNQREVLSYLAEMTVSTFIQYEDKKLKIQKDLRSLLVNARYHQIFHTISKNSEINLFYHELQNTFLIEPALKDLQESLDSLNELFNEREIGLKEKERDTKEKQNIQLGYVLSIITIIGIFSAYNDSLELFGMKGTISPHFVWPVILVLILIIYLILRRRNEKS